MATQMLMEKTRVQICKSDLLKEKREQKRIKKVQSNICKKIAEINEQIKFLQIQQ